MNNEDFVNLLNEDLKLGYRSLFQCVQHLASIKGARYRQTLNESNAHLGQEPSHAATLAKQIDFLGGAPTTTVPDIPPLDDPAEALKQDLELETRELERCRERVEPASELGLPGVADVPSPLLEQTQDHIRERRAALGK